MHEGLGTVKRVKAAQARVKLPSGAACKPRHCTPPPTPHVTVCDRQCRSSVPKIQIRHLFMTQSQAHLISHTRRKGLTAVQQ
jgi:hypothetical protein